LRGPLARRFTGLRRRGASTRVLGPCDGPPPDSGVTPLGNSIPTAANGSIAPLAPDVALAPERQYAFREPAPAPGSYTYKIGEVGQDGSITLHGGVTIVVGGAAVPVRAFLAPAAPNPFNPSTRLEFGIVTAGPMRLDVFDARGRHVRTLAQEAATPGIRRMTWDGRDDAGKGVASGVYVARLQTAGTTQTRRMTLLK